MKNKKGAKSERNPGRKDLDRSKVPSFKRLVYAAGVRLAWNRLAQANAACDASYAFYTGMGKNQTEIAGELSGSGGPRRGNGDRHDPKVLLTHQMTSDRNHVIVESTWEQAASGPAICEALRRAKRHGCPCAEIPDAVGGERNLGETTKNSPANFVAEALADFGTVGAIAPSSRYLTRAMLEPLSLRAASVVVELGPGTGVMTRALLEALPRHATLLAFEINERFTRHLRATVRDPRLVVIKAPAEALQKELSGRGYTRVDAILSSLALGFMSDRQRNDLLIAISASLSDEGTFTQYQYLHGLQFSGRQLSKLDLSRLLGRYFRSVQRKIIWPNLPPAFVFACREAIPSRDSGIS